MIQSFFLSQKWDTNVENVTVAEYIWIENSQIHSKTKVFQRKIRSIDELEWSSHHDSFSLSDDADLFLKPVFVCNDPFRENNSILVLCETFLSDMKTPSSQNFRHICNTIMTEAKEQKPCFGMEQEYYILQKQGSTEWPIGWPKGGFPPYTTDHDCGIGGYNANGRQFVETHFKMCINAGLLVHGINAEQSPAQWEYQIGIGEGIDCADHMWMSRYILYKLARDFGYSISLDPKPYAEFDSSGCHLNFSCEKTRNEGGMDYISEECMNKLGLKHKEHVTVYGEGNDRRSNASAACSLDHFDVSYGDRFCCVRVPFPTIKNGKGFFEDRRPAANVDPYLATAMMADTIILDSKYCDEILNIYQKSKGN